MSLKSRLEALIAAEGPITVEAYMALCLHDPAGGYYATRPALGADGDFITAPLVSQMFGELIGLWCAQTWADMGSPFPVRLVEIGPGDGALMSDALRALNRAAPDFIAAADLWLVETSGPLRGRQSATLAGSGARWADRLEDVPGGAPMILIANEFLDCLPARQFVKDAHGAWAERRVGLGATGGLAFGLAPPPEGFAAPTAFADVEPGVVVEMSPAQVGFAASLGARIARDGGAALLIDYGSAEPEPGDTLQALRRHEKVDPLATPGEADLTFHAGFPAVLAAARATGAQAAILTQGDFLGRLGIEARAQTLAAARPDRTEAIARQLHRLTHAEEMGELFKAVAIWRDGAPTPPAF
ncbi:class I SAM-dependent methyltransferase [soil metagenome]